MTSDLGKVLITFDCEGLWGMADQISPSLRAMITDVSLGWAYRTILDSLDRWNLPATFAFVGFFASPADVVLEQREHIRASKALLEWCRIALGDLESGLSSGWCKPDVIDMTRQRGRHEIASHSYSHLPWTTAGVTEADLRFEAGGVSRWMTQHELKICSFVFPRNQIVRTDLLREIGISAYRKAPQNAIPGKAGRLLNLLEEVLPAHAEPPTTSLEPVGLPAGIPIHWKSGVRRAVPRSSTVFRARRMIEDASREKKVAHFWLHPHNLITGHRQASLLDRILRMVSSMRDQGRIQVVTQCELARQLRTT